MTTPTPADFRARFPELANYSGEKVLYWLAQSDPWFDPARWDTFYTEGVLNWVAHKLVMADATKGINQASAGDVTQKRVGQVSVSRGSDLLSQQMANPFLRTMYGQEYLTLRKTVGMGALAV